MLFYHVWTTLLIYRDGSNNVVQVCSFLELWTVCSKVHEQQNKPVNNIVEAGQFNHVQAGQFNHVQAGQFNHVQAGQFNHVQAGQFNHVQAKTSCMFLCVCNILDFYIQIEPKILLTASKKNDKALFTC